MISLNFLPTCPSSSPSPPTFLLPSLTSGESDPCLFSPWRLLLLLTPGLLLQVVISRFSELECSPASVKGPLNVLPLQSFPTCTLSTNDPYVSHFSGFFSRLVSTLVS